MLSTSAPAPSDRHYYALMAVSAACLIALGIAILASARFAGAMLGEDKPIEMLSAAGYVVVVVAMFRETTFDYVRRHFYFVLVPLAMALREMNFHVEFTTMNMTKSSYYFSGEVPLGEKTIVIAIVLIFGWAVYRMARGHGAAFLRGLRRLDATAVALSLTAICTVTSEGLDGVGRKLAMIGVDMPAGLSTMTVAVEEVVELGIPVFMAIAVFASFPRARYGQG